MTDFTRAQREAAARVLRALAHPVRLGVMQQLAHGELNVSELTKLLECSQSTMSQQLQILENQALIASRRVGTVKYCSLQNPDFLKLFACLGQHLKQYIRVNDHN